MVSAGKQVYLAANVAYVALYLVFRHLATSNGADKWRGRLRNSEELWGWVRRGRGKSWEGEGQWTVYVLGLLEQWHCYEKYGTCRRSKLCSPHLP
jgi:hypothetical protein